MSDTLTNTIEAQLGLTLGSTNFEEIGPLYRGKVRDVYQADDRLVFITTDRVSAFDHVLGTIPFKGEILNALAIAGFEQTKDIVAHHVLEVPDPNVIIGRRCTAYPIEFVVRGHITGSLWRDYRTQGRANAYGLELPANLQKDQRFDHPILTPTTKASRGQHDEPISPAQIVERNLMTREQFDRATEAAFLLFARGQSIAQSRGLILVDTKYELGEDEEGRLTLLDEVHTADSSRFWIAEDYEARLSAGQEQNMLDKENLRSWLIKEQGFSGHGPPPALDDAIRTTLSLRYMQAHERLLGRPFVARAKEVRSRIEANLRQTGWLR